MGKCTSMCAKLAFLVGCSVFGSAGRGTPTNISIAATGACRVLGNSSKGPSTSTSDGSEPLSPKGICLATLTAVSDPRVGCSMPFEVTDQLGFDPSATIEAARRSRAPISGNNKVAAATSGFATSRSILLATLPAITAAELLAPTTSMTCPISAGRKAMWRAKKHPTSDRRNFHSKYSTRGFPIFSGNHPKLHVRVTPPPSSCQSTVRAH